MDHNEPQRKMIIEAAHTALLSTPQLYQYINSDSELFIANGCAVLLYFNNSYYCLSNAHVLADNHTGKTFFLLQDGTSMTVGGQLFFSNHLSSKKRADDSLDIAVVKLNSNVADKLIENGNRFLQLDQLLSGISLMKGNILLLAGHPATRTKIDLKSMRLKFRPLIARTIPYLKKIKKPAFAQGFHHIVEYPISSFRETSSNQRMRAPAPEGLSGSGLWLTVVDGLHITPYLIGILSEYHKEQSIIMSTKIDLYLGLIRQKFDDKLIYEGVPIDLENDED